MSPERYLGPSQCVCRARARLRCMPPHRQQSLLDSLPAFMYITLLASLFIAWASVSECVFLATLHRAFFQGACTISTVAPKFTRAPTSSRARVVHLHFYSVLLLKRARAEETSMSCAPRRVFSLRAFFLVFSFWVFFLFLSRSLFRGGIATVFSGLRLLVVGGRGRSEIVTSVVRFFGRCFLVSQRGDLGVLTSRLGPREGRFLSVPCIREWTRECFLVIRAAVFLFDLTHDS